MSYVDLHLRLPELLLMRVDKMTCAEVHAALQKAGTLILQRPSKQPGVLLFNKYARDHDACALGEYAPLRRIPTKDQKSCPVRQCSQMSHNSHR